MSHWEISQLGKKPNLPSWDPYDEYYARREDGYVDAEGDLVLPEPQIPRQFFPQEEEDDITSKWHTQVDIQALYQDDPVSVDQLEAWLDHQVEASSLAMAATRQDDMVALMNEDSIRAHISDVSAPFDPDYLGEALLERAQQSKVAMGAGATAVDDSGCEIFEQLAEKKLLKQRQPFMLYQSERLVGSALTFWRRFGVSQLSRRSAHWKLRRSSIAGTRIHPCHEILVLMTGC